MIFMNVDILLEKLSLYVHVYIYIHTYQILCLRILFLQLWAEMYYSHLVSVPFK